MKKKKQILFVIPSMFGGGAERIFLHIINNIDRQRFIPILAVGEKSGEYFDSLRKDIEIHHLKSKQARNAVPSLLRLIWKLQPHVVFSTLGMNLAAALAKPFCPPKTRIILREGSSPTAFLADVSRKSQLRAWIYRKAYQNIYRFADVIICQSDYMLHDLRHNMQISPNKLHRIYNPVNFSEIDRLGKCTEKLFYGEGPHLLTVGRLDYEKGYEFLLKAFAKVKREHPTLSLTFIGDGNEKAALETLALNLQLEENVRFLGFQNNPFAYLKQADFFVSSSRYEGFSNVIVESLACGVPVIATDCPSANREVIEEGVNGWLAENENVESLAETIKRAIKEKENLSRERIRYSCESRFALEYILPFYEKHFEG